MNAIRGDFWWTQYISGVTIGAQDSPDRQLFTIDQELAMTDTGTSCSFVPRSHFTEIMDALREALDPHWFIDSWGDTAIPCDKVSEAPTISLAIGGYWLEMSPEDYVLNLDGECWVCLHENTYDEYWVLGDTFLRGYYSVHDYSSMSFGFAPHSRSQKAKPVPATEILTGQEKKFKSWHNVLDVFKWGIPISMSALIVNFFYTPNQDAEDDSLTI